MGTGFVMADFLYNNIAQQLEKEIQGLPEGTRLPSERDMAQKYGVSRNVLREAVRLLSEKGLLNSQPGRGIYVANDSKGKFADRLEELLLHSDSGLAEMVEVRESLEMAIVEKAVLKASDADVRDLMRLYQAMEAARDDVEGFNRLDREFHVQLAKCTHNTIFPILINAFFQITDEKLFLLTELFPGRIDSAQREHRRCVEAILNRDVEEGRAVARKHFSISDLLAHMQQQEKIDKNRGANM